LLLTAQRFALPALGRAAERRPKWKRIRRKKMLGIAPDSPASGARFVGWRFIVQGTLPVKNFLAKNLQDYCMKLLLWQQPKYKPN
jgi:hypothetical protein